jgi:hypothetical protein
LVGKPSALIIIRGPRDRTGVQIFEMRPAQIDPGPDTLLGGALLGRIQ